MKIGQVVLEILKILVNPRTAAILDLVQRLKHIVNISIGQMLRRTKFGGIPSSRAGDIKDFSKSKMAAVPPFWIKFKG